MLAASSFTTELGLPANIFDIDGSSLVGTMFEFPSAPNPGLIPGNLTQSKLVQTDQPVRFHFDWTVKGVFTHAINPNFLWEVEVFMEQYGRGEFSLGPTGRTTVPYGSGVQRGGFPGTVSYSHVHIDIPANTIPAGVYDVVAVIRLLHDRTLTPCFVAAFAEFGKIQFFQEH